MSCPPWWYKNKSIKVLFPVIHSLHKKLLKHVLLSISLLIISNIVLLFQNWTDAFRELCHNPIIALLGGNGQLWNHHFAYEISLPFVWQYLIFIYAIFLIIILLPTEFCKVYNSVAMVLTYSTMKVSQANLITLKFISLSR